MAIKLLKLKVIPNAKKDIIGEQLGEYIKVYITSPPVDNKANKHLIEFLSQEYHVPKSKIKIIQGEKSHFKTIRIEL